MRFLLLSLLLTAFMAIASAQTPCEIVTIFAPDTVCITSAPIKLSAQPTGGKWRSFATDSLSGLFTPSSAGFGPHQVIYESMDDTGCISRDTIEIEIVGVMPSLTDIDSFCSAATACVQLTFMPQGGFWIGTGITDDEKGIWCPTTAGVGIDTLVYNYRDTFNCFHRDTIDGFVKPSPMIDAGKDQRICPLGAIPIGGNPTASGIGSISYIWMPRASLSDDRIPNPTASPTATTTYSITVEDESGCANLDSVTVIVNEDFALLDAGRDYRICLGESRIIGGEPTAESESRIFYEWTPSKGLSFTDVPNPSANPNETTVYTIRISDNFGCEDSDTVLVEVVQNPVANAGEDAIVCEQSKFELGGNPSAQKGTKPYSYQWTPSQKINALIPNPIAKIDAKIVFTLQVTDSNGCLAEDTIRVDVLPALVADAGNYQIICAGETVQIGGSPSASSGLPPYTYQWVDSKDSILSLLPNPRFSIQERDSFFLTVTDGNRCSKTDGVLVETYFIPVVDAGKAKTICQGELTQLGGELVATGGSGNFTYQWIPSPTDGAASISKPFTSPSSSTNYELIVRDDNGCIGKDTTNVTVIQRPDLEILNFSGTYCIDDDIVPITVSLFGGMLTGPGITDGLVFEKEHNETSDFIPDNEPTGIVTSFIVENAPGSVLGEDIFLNQLSVQITHENVGELVIELIAPDGEVYRILDRPGVPETVKGCLSGDIDICVVPGEFTLPKLETECSKDGTAIEGVFHAIDNLDRINNGGSIYGIWKLKVVDEQAGSAVGKIERWSLRFNTKATFEPRKAGPGVFSAEYAYMDCFGCRTEASKMVEVHDLPLIDAGKDMTLCIGDSVTLGGNPTSRGGTGDYTILWQPERGIGASGITVNNPKASPGEPTTYSLTVIDANGCKGITVDSQTTATVRITELLEPPTAGFDVVILSENEVEFYNQSKDGAEFYQWSFGDGAFSAAENPIHQYASSGTYRVIQEVSSVDNCSDTYFQDIALGSTNLPTNVTQKNEYTVNHYHGILTLDGDIQKIKRISLLNIHGQEVRQLEPGKTNRVSGMASGTYIVAIATSKAVTYHRVLL